MIKKLYVKLDQCKDCSGPRYGPGRLYVHFHIDWWGTSKFIYCYGTSADFILSTVTTVLITAETWLLLLYIFYLILFMNKGRLALCSYANFVNTSIGPAAPLSPGVLSFEKPRWSWFIKLLLFLTCEFWPLRHVTYIWEVYFMASLNPIMNLGWHKLFIPLYLVAIRPNILHHKTFQESDMLIPLDHRASHLCLEKLPTYLIYILNTLLYIFILI